MPHFSQVFSSFICLSGPVQNKFTHHLMTDHWVKQAHTCCITTFSSDVALPGFLLIMKTLPLQCSAFNFNQQYMSMLKQYICIHVSQWISEGHIFSLVEWRYNQYIYLFISLYFYYWCFCHWMILPISMSMFGIMCKGLGLPICALYSSVSEVWCNDITSLTHNGGIVGKRKVKSLALKKRKQCPI